MIRFRDHAQFTAITNILSEVLNDYSLELVRADWKRHRNELFANVRRCMDTSAYGIAIFEHISEDTLSPNVCLELGYMLAKDKRCLILKEKAVPKLQADLAGHICSEFEVGRIRETLSAEVTKWLRTLGLVKKPDQKLVVYASHGGTCRDPMAKAITLKALESNPPGYSLRIEAAAFFRPSAANASPEARQAIQEMYGEDLLSNHVASQLTKAKIDEADLILVMDGSMLQKDIFPARKTYLLKKFFGQEGNIADPYRRGIDRYRECAAELRAIIEPNVGRLIERLRPKSKPRNAEESRLRQRAPLQTPKAGLNR